MNRVSEVTCDKQDTEYTCRVEEFNGNGTTHVSVETLEMFDTRESVAEASSQYDNADVGYYNLDHSCELNTRADVLRCTHTLYSR